MANNYKWYLDLETDINPHLDLALVIPYKSKLLLLFEKVMIYIESIIEALIPIANVMNTINCNETRPNSNIFIDSLQLEATYGSWIEEILISSHMVLG